MGLPEDLSAALNKNSAENDSNTPDFILVKFLLGCLVAFNNATNERTRRWYAGDQAARIAQLEAQLAEARAEADKYRKAIERARTVGPKLAYPILDEAIPEFMRSAPPALTEEGQRILVEGAKELFPEAFSPAQPERVDMSKLKDPGEGIRLGRVAHQPETPKEALLRGWEEPESGELVHYARWQNRAASPGSKNYGWVALTPLENAELATLRQQLESVQVDNENLHTAQQENLRVIAKCRQQLEAAEKERDDLRAKVVYLEGMWKPVWGGERAKLRELPEGAVVFIKEDRRSPKYGEHYWREEVSEVGLASLNWPASEQRQILRRIDPASFGVPDKEKTDVPS